MGHRRFPLLKLYSIKDLGTCGGLLKQKHFLKGTT